MIVRLAAEQVVLAQQMSKTILALDQSTQKTGWAVYTDAQLVDFGCVDATGDLFNRIIKLREWVKQKIEKLGGIDCLVMEEIQLQQIPGTSREGNIATFKKLAYVQAILIELSIDLQIPYAIVPSSTWKSNCGIKGRSRTEQKQNAQNWVENKYKVRPIQDTCDAICIGTSYLIEENEKNDVEGISWE